MHMIFSGSRRATPRRALGVLLLVGASACQSDLSVTNPNSVGVAALDADVRNSVQFRATGVLAFQRAQMPGFISDVGILGRESYNFTPTEGRNTSHYLTSAGLPNNSFVTGSWTNRYNDIRGIRDMIAIAETPAAGNNLTPSEVAGVRGFGNTMWALDLYHVIATRDTLGAPVEIQANPDSVSRFVRRDSVYRFILAKLDSAAADLNRAGGAFSFALHSGFAGFNTPASFRRFNRAVAARINVHFGTLGGGASRFTAALGNLSDSFIDTTSTANLNAGVFHIFSTSTGDALNGISPQVSPDQVAHPSINDDAALRPDGSKDARFTGKVRTISPRTTAGITTTFQYTLYPLNTSSIPVIRNEELILLRAEANLGLGNIGAALTDINTIRVRSGGLAASTLTSASPSNDVLTELLTQKRYSLMFEGHRWVDMRRYGRMTQLPLARATDIRLVWFPVPVAECDARSNLIRALRAARVAGADQPFVGFAAPSCPAVL
jgi:starch-binding outer membrane protein, SusD/RagB family